MFFFFGDDGLQRLELLRERVHLRFQFAVTLAIHLKLRDFLIQLRSLPDGLIDFVAFLRDRRERQVTPTRTSTTVMATASSTA